MSNKNEPQILISRQLGQALVEYLKQRPYAEVHVLMDALLRAPSAQLAPEPENKE